MNQNNILDLLEKDARLNAQDLSDILNEPKDEIEKTIKELEDKKNYLWLSYSNQLQPCPTR